MSSRTTCGVFLTTRNGFEKPERIGSIASGAKKFNRFCAYNHQWSVPRNLENTYKWAIFNFEKCEKWEVPGVGQIISNRIRIFRSTLK